jgi:hypothetical protein
MTASQHSNPAAAPHDFCAGKPDITPVAAAVTTAPGKPSTMPGATTSAWPPIVCPARPPPAWMPSASRRWNKGLCAGYDGSKQVTGRQRDLGVDLSGWCWPS